MSQCPFQPRLGAFHDKELDADLATRLASHLDGCPSCSEELRGIRQVSQAFRPAQTREMSQMGMARLHAVADAAARRRDVFPMARALMAVAASVLIIGGAWLVEIPKHSAGTQIVRPAPTQEAAWEKLASGEKLNLKSQGLGEETRYAERINFSKFMLESLTNQDSGS